MTTHSHASFWLPINQRHIREELKHFYKIVNSFLKSLREKNNIGENVILRRKLMTDSLFRPGVCF